jgi:DNA-binding response OmpR family regulator
MRWARARGRPGLGRILGRGRSPTPARVLVAYDDDVIRQLITVYLTAAGFTVIQAATGAEALDLAGRSCVQIAVLDASMPPPDGWEVARQLRSDPAVASIKSVVMLPSGVQTPSLTGAGAADAFLAKPFSAPELVALILALAERNLPRVRRRKAVR